MDDTVDPDAEITFSRAGFEPIEPPRPLTEWEQAVVETIGREPGSLAVTEECRCGCASLGFLPPDPHLADIGHGARHVARPGMDQRVGELEGRDADGVPIWAILFQNEAGILVELEVQRADGEPIRKLPGPAAMWDPLRP